MSPPIEPKIIETLATQPRWNALMRADEPLDLIPIWIAACFAIRACWCRSTYRRFMCRPTVARPSFACPSH